jgi:glutathione S-transferase
MDLPRFALHVDAQFASPYAMSAYVALREKGIAFDLRKVDLSAGEQHADAYASVSLTRRVPTLVDGDFALSESSAITEYLDDLQPAPPLYPREPRARARARQVQAWLRSDLMPIRSERSTVVVFARPNLTPLSADAGAAAQRLFTLADALLPPGAASLFGAWSIADTDLALMLQRLNRNGDAVPARLADYAAAQWERASVQEWVRLPRAL